jgi:prepilin-type N-terminal cleavage/methylation domain-containing protein
MKKGFTLIELLIVIAILAVLSVTVVVVLNPAELLKQSRDATRLSDLSSINSAIALYLTDYVTPRLWYSGGVPADCSAYHANITNATTSPFSGAATTNATAAVDGSGWAAVNLAAVTGGSPLARLPIDPTNTGNYYYAYACGTGTNGPLNYELDTFLESAKFAPNMLNTKDGGNNNSAYEMGNNLSQ